MESSKFGELSASRDGGPPRAAACRSCGAEMWWVVTRAGKNMPVNPDDTPHWGTCPESKDWQKAKAASPPPAEAPVWNGHVELDDTSDPGWYVIRVENSDLKPGDRVRLKRA